MEWALLGFIVALYWLNQKAKQAAVQIHREEIVREVVRRTIQKKKLDELYGRSEDSENNRKGIK